MDEMNRSKLIRTTQLEDFPEMIHRIQSLLAAEEAARTCVLSKSWLHAWSTIPTLRFTKCVRNDTEEETKYMNLIDNTLLRYHRDNIPIESLDLHFTIKNKEYVSLVNKWIRLIASKSCLKELILTISVDGYSSTYLHRIFSGENLNKIRVTSNPTQCTSPWINSFHYINCVSLRVLELLGVRIHEEVLHHLLSTCSLLEKMNLLVCNRMEMIKVKNLHHLQELQISSERQLDSLEVDDVPCLHSFFLDKAARFYWKPTSINMGSLGSVTQLSLGGVIIDDAFFDMIKSKFHFLESLTLQIVSCNLEIMNITCLSLKRLTIQLYRYKEIYLQVYAPKLLHFSYIGFKIPSLLFPTVSPELIKLTVHLRSRIDHSLFLKINEMLNLPSTFDIEIVHKRILNYSMWFNLPIGALRRSVPFPNMNVRRILFSTYSDVCSGEHLQFFDAIFSVCHPSYVTVCQPIITPTNESLSNHLVNEVMEKKIKEGYWPELKDVEVKILHSANWEVLTKDWVRDESPLDDWSYVEYKLNWCSP